MGDGGFPGGGEAREPDHGALVAVELFPIFPGDKSVKPDDIAFSCNFRFHFQLRSSFISLRARRDAGIHFRQDLQDYLDFLLFFPFRTKGKKTIRLTAEGKKGQA